MFRNIAVAGIFLLGAACSLHGAPLPTYVNSTGDTFYNSSISATDLVNQGRPTYSSVTVTRAPNTAFGSGGHNDGASTSGSVTNNVFYDATDASNSITYFLNTTSNTNGYDLQTLSSIAGWSSGTPQFANQKYEVLVSQVGSPVFRSLGVFTNTPYTGTASSSTSSRTTIVDSTGLLANNVDAIRFNLIPTGIPSSNGTVIREIDVTGLASSTAAPAFTNLVTNGSFESSPNGGFTAIAPGATSLTGWTVSGGNVTIVKGQFGTTASDGGAWLSLENTGSSNNFGTVSQTITTVPGQAYTLSFDYNALDRGSAVVIGSPWSMTYNLGAGPVTVTQPSLGTGINTPELIQLAAWNHLETTFVATGATTTLTFTGAAQIGGFYGMAIDNVALVAIPEPRLFAALALLALPLVLRRQRRA